MSNAKHENESKEAVKSMVRARTNMDKVLRRNEVLERELLYLADSFDSVKKYISDKVYPYNTQQSVNEGIDKVVKQARDLL